MRNQDAGDAKLRAARHAALGDQHRLRIVDRLTSSDLSPTELGAALGMRANLVAHHLNVLQAVGIIHRSRSEADKRRSYVRLVEGALEGLRPCVSLAARRVVFASTGASARAPLAVALWSKASPIPATSGGTMPAEAVSVGALAAARRHSVQLLEQIPRTLEEVLTDGDMVITVCDQAKEQIAPIGDLHWSISDPGRVGSDASFDAAFDEIHRRVAELAPRVVTS